MVYFTGDIHGAVNGVAAFINKVHPAPEDVIILLGDVGANYYRGRKDDLLKGFLNDAGPVFLCTHGNHEMRPTSIPGYIEREWNGGVVWVQPEYPNLLFAKDGEIYTLGGLRYLVIGGAYSVDKYYRLIRGWGWWPDEQPSDEIKAYVERQIREDDIDIVLSHTCPFKYEPTEMFLSGIDQSTVDDSTERWLDKIEKTIEYKAWFCGHWHTVKIPKETYDQASKILAKQGLTLEAACVLFLKETVRQGRIPFDYTEKDLEEAKNMPTGSTPREIKSPTAAT